MSTRFDIGPGLSCDLDLLIASRMLVQASSGQGKTRTIRRLLEQTHGRVQHLVIDPEGEYATLREKFDYVLAAPKGGDVVAHPRYAKDLALKLLELNVSAILDIYELNPQDRKAFVRAFLFALVDAPRDLWHPCLVVLDEAHVFCPEKGEAESAAAVEALSTRGRKRGFCLIAATQRLAKFKKDAAAELANKLIGGTNLDIDIDRAGEELGIPKGQRVATLRGLAPGQFWAFGRAFLHAKTREPIVEPVQVLVGDVATTHPSPGQSAPPTPPPTAKVRAALEKLTSLPAEAEAREKSVADLQQELADLKRANTKLLRENTDRMLAHQAYPAPSPERVEVPVLRPHESQLLEDATTALVGLSHDIGLLRNVDTLIGGAHNQLSEIRLYLKGKVDAVGGASGVAGARGVRKGPHPSSGEAPAASTPTPRHLAREASPFGAPRGKSFTPADVPASSDGLNTGQQRILNIVMELEWRDLAPNLVRIAKWQGLHPNGGTYKGNVRALKQGGLLNDDLTLTEAGRRAAQVQHTRGLTGIPVQAEAQRAILNLFAEHGTLNLPELAAHLGVHPNGGTFKGNLRHLVLMGVVDKHGMRDYVLSPAARK